jgi:methylated-DNA-[protein]-cysteine S-methyltransferase
MIKNTSMVSEKDILDHLYVQNYKSPIGDLCLAASKKGLKWIKMVKEYIPVNKPNIHTTLAVNQLEMYFMGNLQEFDLIYDLDEYSDFSKRVWSQLQLIPFGKTITYKQLAKQLGDIKCIRAAGTANGRNPIPIIIPCHRVIGSDGGLTGFALGIDIKKQLLLLENPGKFSINQMSIDF